MDIVYYNCVKFHQYPSVLRFRLSDKKYERMPNGLTVIPIYPLTLYLPGDIMILHTGVQTNLYSIDIEYYQG